MLRPSCGPMHICVQDQTKSPGRACVTGGTLLVATTFRNNAPNTASTSATQTSGLAVLLIAWNSPALAAIELCTYSSSSLLHAVHSSDCSILDKLCSARKLSTRLGISSFMCVGDFCFDRTKSRGLLARTVPDKCG